jgi:hypothetical protein
VHQHRQDRRDLLVSQDNAVGMVHPDKMVPMEIRVPMAMQAQPALPVSLEFLVDRAVRVSPVKSLIKLERQALPVHLAHLDNLEAMECRAETVIQEVPVNKDHRAIMVHRDVQETTECLAVLVGMAAKVLAAVAIIVLHHAQHPATVYNRCQCQQLWRVCINI